MRGIIVKGIAGFYYVSCGDETIECKARGIFKNRGITPAVGDDVEISLTAEPGKGVIEDILPRKNVFIRPPIANIDTFIVVMAAAHPKPNFPVIDKFLVMADAKGTDIVICVNKIDIAKPKDIESIREIYEGLYPVVMASAETGAGIDELKSKLSGKKAAFAGPSGVGKSSILNAILPQANAQMGEISHKTKRGSRRNIRFLMRTISLFCMSYTRYFLGSEKLPFTTNASLPSSSFMKYFPAILKSFWLITNLIIFSLKITYYQTSPLFFQGIRVNSAV